MRISIWMMVACMICLWPHQAAAWKEIALIMSALHGSYSGVQRLMSYNTNLYAQDDMGDTALHKSILSEDPYTTKILIDNGAPVNMLNCDTEFPIHVAARSGNIHSLLELLAHGAYVSRNDMEHDRATHIIYYSNDTSLPTPCREAWETASRYRNYIVRSICYDFASQPAPVHRLASTCTRTAQFHNRQPCQTCITHMIACARLALGQGDTISIHDIMKSAASSPFTQARIHLHAIQLYCHNRVTYRNADTVYRVLNTLNHTKQHIPYLIHLTWSLIPQMHITTCVLSHIMNISWKQQAQHRDNNGNSLLHILAQYPHYSQFLPQALALCMQCHDHSARNMHNETPVMIAYKHGNLSYVDDMLALLSTRRILACPHYTRGTATTHGSTVLDPHSITYFVTQYMYQSHETVPDMITSPRLRSEISSTTVIDNAENPSFPGLPDDTVWHIMSFLPCTPYSHR